VRRALVALLAVATLAGCGSTPPDLFEVKRTGEGTNARLDMVVNDGGAVTCNGRDHPLDAKRLLQARQLARDLEKQAQLGLELPPGPGSVLAYRVRLESGTVAFADTSRDLPTVFTRVELFTRDVSEDVCAIKR
jgi:hypothetical protein